MYLFKDWSLMLVNEVFLDINCWWTVLFGQGDKRPGSQRMVIPVTSQMSASSRVSKLMSNMPVIDLLFNLVTTSFRKVLHSKSPTMYEIVKTVCQIERLKLWFLNHYYFHCLILLYYFICKLFLQEFFKLVLVWRHMIQWFRFRIRNAYSNTTDCW